MPVLTNSGSEKEKEANFDELRHGKTFAHTQAKFGKKRAEKQMIAIALGAQREGKQKAAKRKAAQRKASLPR